MILILAYHGVNAKDGCQNNWVVYGNKKFDLDELRVDPHMFEQQMEHLHSRGYQSVGLEEFLVDFTARGRYFKKHFVLTFDDGYKDFFTSVRPILNRYGYTATVFLVTDKINENNKKGQFLSWEEAIQLHKEGFSFGAHTCSHPSLTSLSLDEARYQIEESKKIIEGKLNSSVRFFSYPYGDFNSDIQNLVREAGFLGAVVTPWGPGIENGIFSLKRVGVNSTNPMWIFRLKANGVFSWVRDNKMLWPLLTKIKRKYL